MTYNTEQSAQQTMVSDRTATFEERCYHQQNMTQIQANHQAGYNASSNPSPLHFSNQKGTPCPTINTTPNNSANPSLAELEHQQNLVRMLMNLNQVGFSGVPAFVPVHHDGALSPDILSCHKQ